MTGQTAKLILKDVKRYDLPGGGFLMGQELHEGGNVWSHTRIGIPEGMKGIGPFDTNRMYEVPVAPRDNKIDPPQMGRPQYPYTLVAAGRPLAL
jgi:hypothetical protein